MCESPNLGKRSIAKWNCTAKLFYIIWKFFTKYPPWRLSSKKTFPVVYVSRSLYNLLRKTICFTVSRLPKLSYFLLLLSGFVWQQKYKWSVYTFSRFTRPWKCNVLKELTIFSSHIKPRRQKCLFNLEILLMPKMSKGTSMKPSQYLWVPRPTPITPVYASPGLLELYLYPFLSDSWSPQQPFFASAISNRNLFLETLWRRFYVVIDYRVPFILEMKGRHTLVGTMLEFAIRVSLSSLMIRPVCADLSRMDKKSLHVEKSRNDKSRFRTINAMWH